MITEPLLGKSAKSRFLKRVSFEAFFKKDAGTLSLPPVLEGAVFNFDIFRRDIRENQVEYLLSCGKKAAF
ncbi:MAG: hypothetical protein ACYYK0_00455 [Candidatus Eutrophobiaceae bacterium]